MSIAILVVLCVIVYMLIRLETNLLDISKRLISLYRLASEQDTFKNPQKEIHDTLRGIQRGLPYTETTGHFLGYKEQQSVLKSIGAKLYPLSFIDDHLGEVIDRLEKLHETEKEIATLLYNKFRDDHLAAK